MEQLINVITLPTEDKSHIGLYTDVRGDLNIYYRNELTPKIKTFFPQHLYATVSQETEPIKEGDWFISGNDGELKRFNRGSVFSESRKIIATTDYLLSNGETALSYIPQVQQSFLKEFVANPDGEYAVDYDWCDVPYTNDMPIELKLNKDNTVNIIKTKKIMSSQGRLVDEALERSEDNDRMDIIGQNGNDGEHYEDNYAEDTIPNIMDGIEVYKLDVNYIYDLDDVKDILEGMGLKLHIGSKKTPLESRLISSGIFKKI